MRKNRVYLIAEAGVNHNGSMAAARRLIDAAARAGADAVKFQAFRADDIATFTAPCARYQKNAMKKAMSQHAMLRALELGEDDHAALMRHCRARGIAYIASPFDVKSVRMLARLGVRIIKIPSGQITDREYLEEVGALGRKIILSTGMAEVAEIDDALRVLAESGTARSDIIILQCTTEYPAPFDQVNLRAIVSLGGVFKMPVGYSDHTVGIEAAVAAVALGAKVIEKHLTLDSRMQGPDHKASLEPEGFAALVQSVRNVESALGDGVKKVMPSEAHNRKVVRKSIVASRTIRRGELFTDENITVKRPGTGISAMRRDSVMGRRAKKSFIKDELIEL